jgi:ABC-2 type transport system ATP-binding protein
VPESAVAAADAAPVMATGLVKTYGEVTAVDHVEMEVRTGDVYGFLGPNGAGKTTTLRMLLGLIRPTEGRVALFGRDPLSEGARALDGVAGFVEAPGFYPYMSGRKNLDLLAAFDGDGARGRIDEVLDVVELTKRAKHRVGGYSHGMRQRLGIAAALLRNPRLLLLDEPATGLDPAGMRDMRALIHRLAEGGITVLLSSHLLSEVEELCNRVGIIRSGRIVYEGTLSDLRQQASDGYLLRTTDNRRALEVCQRQTGIAGAVLEPAGVRFHASEDAVAALSIALVQSGLAITELSGRHATLEDLFFRFTEGNGAEASSLASAAAADGADGLLPQVLSP